MTTLFATHMREAIALNRERLPLYARLTGGASVPISRRLIRAEQMALPIAVWFDSRAQPFEVRGIPLLSDAFVSMDHTPTFQAPAAPEPPPPWLFGSRDALQLARAASRGYKRDGWAGALLVLERGLDALGESPCYGCMVRHLLESAVRIALLAPRHAADAERLGLRSPVALSWRLVWLHLAGLGQAAALDRQAVPLQARGIPIVCQDVPPIPRP